MLQARAVESRTPRSIRPGPQYSSIRHAPCFADGMAASVLVIDDNEELLALYDAVLRYNGYGVTTLSEPPTTLEAIRSADPDVVILDLHFGGQQFEGWAVLQLMRNDPSLIHVPVIVCTAGEGEVRDAAELLRRHNVWVLLKPFVVTDLERLLREALASVAPPPPLRRDVSRASRQEAG